MKKPFKITPDDFHLLMQEITALSDLLKEERLKRREEIDQLKLVFAALRKTLGQFHPDFDSQYKSIYADLILRFDPETESLLDQKSDESKENKKVS